MAASVESCRSRDFNSSDCGAPDADIGSLHLIGIARCAVGAVVRVVAR